MPAQKRVFSYIEEKFGASEYLTNIPNLPCFATRKTKNGSPFLCAWTAASWGLKARRSLKY